MNLLLAEFVITRPAGLGFKMAAVAAPLTDVLGTAAPVPTFKFSLGILAWVRSSSHDPMVAARLASLPLLPTGVSEGTVETTAGGTSSCLFNSDRGVVS